MGTNVIFDLSHDSRTIEVIFMVITLPKSVNHYSSGLTILMHGFISLSQFDKDVSSVN